MHIKIPLSTFMRCFCIYEVSHYKVTVLSSLVILVGCAVSMLSLIEVKNMLSPLKVLYYALIIVFSGILDVVSLTIREVIVRY